MKKKKMNEKKKSFQCIVFTKTKKTEKKKQKFKKKPLEVSLFCFFTGPLFSLRLKYFYLVFCLSRTPSTCHKCTALAFSLDLTSTVMTHMHHVLHSTSAGVKNRVAHSTQCRYTANFVFLIFFRFFVYFGCLVFQCLGFLSFYCS